MAQWLETSIGQRADIYNFQPYKNSKALMVSDSFYYICSLKSSTTQFRVLKQKWEMKVHVHTSHYRTVHVIIARRIY